jgi:hypothetical protein
MDKVDYEAKLAAEVKKLEDFQKALAEEHRKIDEEANGGQPILEASKVYAAVEQKLLRSVSQAADTVVELLEHADKDATRFAVAKYIIDGAKLSPSAQNENPFDEILRKINAPSVSE